MPLCPPPTRCIVPPTTHGIPYWTMQVCVTRSNETPPSLPLTSMTSPEPLSPHELRDLNPTLPYKNTVATFSLPRNYLTR